MPRGNAIDWHDWERSIKSKAGVWRDRNAFEDYSYRSVFEHLIAVRRSGDLAPHEVPLICVLRNEAAFLPLFFDHYKRLGVTRFIMIDNGSNDGSHELLLAEKAADIYFTRTSFIEGQSGLYWANGLAHALCEGYWTLRVDADELLVYDGMAEHGLAELAQWLTKQGMDRFFAPMRDLYSSAPLTDRKSDISEILKEDSWFDGEGYTFSKWDEGWQLCGGPRQRLIGEGFQIRLSKYPFFRMTKELSIAHHHYLWPLDQARPDLRGALLHLKMIGDFIGRSERLEREGQHWNRSKVYRTVNQKLREAPETVAICAHSRRYEEPKSLIRHGLMQPIDWGA